MTDHWRPNAEFYESLIETSPLVVVRLAREDRAVRYISPNITRLFGLAAEAVTSSAFRGVDIIHPDDLEAARSAFQSFLADTSVPMTSYFRIRTAEGASRWIVARFREDPAHSDDLFGFLLDIHDRVVADEALRGAKEEAERASRARDERLTRLRDELKAPLDAILDAARLLEADDLAGPDREAVDRILSGGLHARALIDQDLDRSRIESVPRVDG